MATEIKVPALGESVSEATVAKWFKKPGDAVAVDEPLVELETDKVTVEVNAPAAGALTEIIAAEGAEVAVGALLGRIEAGAAGASAKPAPAKPAQAAPAAQAQARTEAKPAAAQPTQPEAPPRPLSPAVRRIIDETDVDPSRVAGTGKDGRITKGDVQEYLDRGEAKPAAAKPAAEARAPDARGEERVRMSRLRRLVAQRLKEAQNTAAMLTTFNEVDMGAVMAIRADYRDTFEKKHGVKLGFMSFFVKAAIVALKDFPAVNAEIQGDEIVYKNYYDIGIAVGTESGLVVPVLRDADALGFADIEKKIGDFGRRARDGKLAMEELQGGTFTVTNGGVFGSLLSTPILNPPQSGILGMHKIQQRPMVDEKGAIVARPMMYLALSYDHRIVDGREAVSFLVRIKDCVEDPRRVLFDL